MKNHHHLGHAAPTANSKSVIHEAIATRAYELWLERGQPDNQSERIWLEAEREQVSGRKAVAADPVLSVSF